MPDVGVLQLSIEDNSKQAGQGLEYLAGALSDLKTKTAGGLNLPTASIKNFAKAVSENSKTLSNTGTFLNAMKEYHKAFKDAEKVKFNSKPIEALKEAIGDGFKIGSAGTQINKIREALGGDWDTAKSANMKKVMEDLADGSRAIAGSSMSSTATNVTKLAKALSEYAVATEQVKKAVGDKAQNTVKETVQSNGPRFPLSKYSQFFGGKETQSPGQISMFEEVKESIEEVTSQYKDMHDTMQNNPLPDFGSALYKDIEKIMDSPLEHLRDIYRTPTHSMDEYKNAVDAVLPKVQKMSSEEMVMAGQAKIVARNVSEINEIFEALGKPNVNNFAENFQKYADDVAGVTREMKSAKESAFTLLEGAPTTDQNSPFEYASEELSRLMMLMNKSKDNMEFWSQKYDEIQRRIKYNGTTTERENELSQAEKGFYLATAQVEEYEKSIKELNEQIARYNELSKGTGSIRSLYENPNYGPAMGGYFGEERQTAIIKEIANGTGLSIDEIKKQIEEVSNGAVQFEKAVTTMGEAAKTVASSGGAEKVKEQVKGLGISAGEATSKIELLRNKVEELKRSYNAISQMPAELFGGKDGKDSALNNVELQIGRVNEQIDKLVQKSHEAQQAMKFEGMKSAADNLQRSYGADMVNDMVEKYNQIELLSLKYDGMKQALADDINQNKVDTQQIAERTIAIKNLQDKINDLCKAEDDASQSSKRLKDRLIEMFNSDKKGGFSKLLSQFARIAKYRFLRSVIRYITSGFSEGVQNVYNYSKAIGSSFAPSMDAAASSLQQLKNSVGAAVAPAIQAIIPVLQTVINWFITGINYINQFFALLNGQNTWTRAIPATVNAFGKQEKAAKSAGAAMKDLLADWDELNIIQSQSGGGAGGGATNAAEDYLKMFEEVNRFDNRVKDIVNFVKDNFDTIKSTAIAIGAAMLAWKVAQGIYEVLNLVNTLKGGIIMTAVGFTLSADAGRSIGANGFNATNTIEAIGGLVASGFGGKWIGQAALAGTSFASVGGLVGAITGVGFALGIMIKNVQAAAAENAYGTIEQDAETIRENVMSYFNPEVEALISVTSARISDLEDAQTKVTNALAVLEQDYPIAVTLKTQEARDQLKMDISNLVQQTNYLISQRKQNIRIPIVASGQYGKDSDSLIKFSDEQWNKTSEYVTGLGEKMGKLISDGITDGAELDKLREQLTAVVRAATYGTKAGEFAGRVALAGSELRNNGYTKSTIEGYIETYNQERKRMVDEANAAAIAEKAELGALKETVEERYKNGDATLMEYLKAVQAYNKFDVTARAEQYLREWVGEGDKQFAKDIGEALQKVMENNTNGMSRWQLKNTATNSALTHTAQEYVNSLKSSIMTVIENETGLEREMLNALFDMTGTSPMDLFDEKFAEEVRSGIVERLRNSDFTMEEKKEIADLFGIDVDDIYVDNKPEDKALFDFRDLLPEHLFDSSFDMHEYLRQQFGDKPVEVEMPVAPEPVIDTKEFSEDLKNDIDAALEDMKLDEMEMIELNLKYDSDDIQDYLDEIGYNTGKLQNTPLRMSAAGIGYSDIPRSGGQYVTGGQVVVEEKDNAQEVTNIANGVERGNSNMTSVMNSILSVVQAISRKDTTVVVSPSSGWGMFNERANSMAARVKG